MVSVLFTHKLVQRPEVARTSNEEVVELSGLSVKLKVVKFGRTLGDSLGSRHKHCVLIDNRRLEHLLQLGQRLQQVLYLFELVFRLFLRVTIRFQVPSEQILVGQLFDQQISARE